jgi:hypothetical protein
MAAFISTMPTLTGNPLEINPSELSQRVAVIKRFKELLKSQRDRFQTYLDALDRQKDIITKGSADDLLRHVELEEKIVFDIFSMQKVIDPLEKMYQKAKTDNMAGDSKFPGVMPNQFTAELEVSNLKETLECLKAEAVVRSEKNRDLLAKRMAELRSEIKSLRKSTYSQRRFGNDPAPSLLDIKG